MHKKFLRTFKIFLFIGFLGQVVTLIRPGWTMVASESADDEQYLSHYNRQAPQKPMAQQPIEDGNLLDGYSQFKRAFRNFQFLMTLEFALLTNFLMERLLRNGAHWQAKAREACSAILSRTSDTLPKAIALCRMWKDPILRPRKIFLSGEGSMESSKGLHQLGKS